MSIITPTVESAKVIKETRVEPTVVGIQNGDRVVASLGESRIVGSVYQTSVVEGANGPLIGVWIAPEGAPISTFPIWLEDGWTLEAVEA